MKLSVIELDQVAEGERDAALALFPAARQNELLRLQRPADRMRSMAAEACLRLEIMQTLRIPNNAISLLRTEKGKPYLANAADFHFNLSHSGSFAVCASDASPVGADIQEVRPIAYEPILTRCFSEGERTIVAGASDPLSAFYRVWTAKESVVKFRGSTLADDLKSLDVSGEVSLGGLPLGCLVQTYGAACGRRSLSSSAADGYFLSVCTGKGGKKPEVLFRTASEIFRAFLAAARP